MRWITETRLARLLLILVLFVNAWGLFPELTISRVDLNDNALHYALIQGVVHEIEHHRNPFDWWAPDWSLGYPVLRTYQPLGHLLVAAIYFALGKSVSLMTVFVWVRYLSVLLLPLSFFFTARCIGLDELPASAAAILAPLISTSALYGLEYGSYLWAGSGLFTQAIASHFFLLSIGLGFRALKQGRSLALTGCVVGLTFLAHFIYGYMAGLTLLLLVLLPDSKTSRTTRLIRLGYLGAAALAIAAFELVPLLKDGAFINRSRWEYAWKWDSFGATQVLKWLFTGELLDHGRLPVLSLLALAGFGVCAWTLWRRPRTLDADTRATEVFIGAGALAWILVLFGRPFWGPVLTLLLATDTLQLHRVIGGAQVFLILLGAVGLGAIWRLSVRRYHLAGAAAAFAITALLLYPMVAERARYLANNAKWGRANLAAAAVNQQFVKTALNTASMRDGRTYAGLAASWGASFRIGDIPFYAYLSGARIPTLGFLFHSMALTSDVMVRFDERNPNQYRLFNVNTVIAPQRQVSSLPPFLTPINQTGPLVIMEPPGSGYFGYFDVVDALYSVRVTRDTFYDVADRWLQSGWVGQKQHLVLDLNGTMPSASGRLSPDDPLPAPPALPVPGTVRNEQHRQDTDAYEADVSVARPSYVLFKMTWHPNWAAYINGVRQQTRMLSPGFVGVPVGPEVSHITLRYEPETWKLLLVLIGPLLAGLFFAGERKGYVMAAERWVQSRSITLPLSPEWRYRWLTILGLVILSLPVWVALTAHALPEGHDATEYLPRAVEFHQNVARGIFVPRWSQDLSDGAGQPLFLFNPPMIYYLSEPWHLLGFDFVRSLNLACLVLVLASALAMFHLGRLFGGDAGGWLASAGYIYAPYFCVDLYVRSAWAEFAAFPFFAITLYGFAAFARQRKAWQLALGATGYAGVLLSHNPAALLFTPLVLSFNVFVAWRERSQKLLLHECGGVVLGLGLAAFVWLPALLDRPFVQLDLLLQGYLRYTNHFVYVHQLWSSFWGYGLSVAGDGDGMSFSLGWSHLLLAGVTISALITVRKFRTARPMVLFFALAAMILCWLTLSTSQWIWDHLRLLQYVEFPWRLLGPVTVCLAVLMAPLGACLWSMRNKFWFALALALLIVPNLPHLHPAQFRAVDLEFWTPAQIAIRHIGADTADEYRPRWLQPTAFSLSPSLPALQQARSTPELWTGVANAGNESQVEIPIAFFPGWQVRVDGRAVPVEPSPTGLLRIRVPAGQHHLAAQWTGNVPCRIGDAISLLSFLAWITLLAGSPAKRWFLRTRHAHSAGALLHEAAETVR